MVVVVVVVVAAVVVVVVDPSGSTRLSSPGGPIKGSPVGGDKALRF